MNISIACDHGAYALKERLKARLLEQGHHVADCGAHSAESCDYPDFAAAAARLVADGSCARGEQTYKSDVDLLVEFSEDIDPIKCGPDIIQLKGDISPSSLEFPEVDMHVVIGDGWRNSKKLYHQNVRREGIEIWGTQKIHT